VKPTPILVALLALGPLLALPDPLGPRAARAEEPWERAVARAQRQQERLLKSAKTRGTGLANVVRRYKQQVIREGSSLNYYLLGRVLYYDKRPDETVRHMRRALQLDPRFYFADLALAIVYLDKKRPGDAEYHILELRRKKPQHLQGMKLEVSLRMSQRDFPTAERLVRQILARVPDDLEARRALAFCFLGMQDWKRARTELRFLIARSPRDLTLRSALADCHMRLKDWKAAASELRQLVRLAPKDPQVRWQLGVALYEQGAFVDAASQIETLRALTKDRPLKHVFDLLQVLYGKLERHDDRIEVLESMLPLIEDEEERKQLLAVIDALKRRDETTAPPPEWKRNPLAELLERCVHEDVAIRRQALHEYYEVDLPFVDPIIYRRYDPKVEPDATCRIWVVRILGRYRAGEADTSVVQDVSRYVALALEDPEARVRTVASEELGHIGAKTGVIYLLPHLESMKLDPIPEVPAERRRLETEFNASRLALCALTGRRDIGVGEADWVPAARMAEVRAGWKTWLDEPEGVAVRLEALEELAELKEVDPLWHLRYVLGDVVGAAPAVVALATYRVLRDRVRALGEKAAEHPWWMTFPILPDAEVTEAGLPKLRERLRAWWSSRPSRNPKRGG
jgi:tetratricopeptide (TPR) repeat protein